MRDKSKRARLPNASVACRVARVPSGGLCVGFHVTKSVGGSSKGGCACVHVRWGCVAVSRSLAWGRVWVGESHGAGVLRVTSGWRLGPDVPGGVGEARVSVGVVRGPACGWLPTGGGPRRGAGDASREAGRVRSVRAGARCVTGAWLLAVREAAPGGGSRGVVCARPRVGAAPSWFSRVKARWGKSSVDRLGPAAGQV